MKIIISPSKLQEKENRISLGQEVINYPQKTHELFECLDAQSSETIGKWMKVKGKLLSEVMENIRGYHELPRVHAISCYNGIVFKEIDETLYNKVQYDYLERHVRILSAFYGVVTPLTGIKPYRLDMTMKPNDTNLYKYWEDEINDYFKEDDIIINLASKEFSKMLKSKLYKHRMINIYFKEEQYDGKLKVVTVRAKQARGLMVNYMVENFVEDPESLKRFDEMGYVFEAALSDDLNYVFVKRES